MLSDLLFRLRALVRRKNVEGELDEELRFHFDEQVEKYVRSGLSQVEAVRRARLTFGGMEQLKEECRDARGVAFVDTLLKDIRYGLRTLRRSPGFTIVAVLTLALGIGVNTTLFTAYDSIALRPLPVGGPDTVMRLERWLASGSLGNGQYAFSYPEYAFHREHNTAFSSLVAASWPLRVFAALPDTNGLTQFHEPEKASAQLVSANYFSALGVPALAGRTFVPEEDQPPGRHPVVVLSYPFWQRKFGSDVQVLGRIIKVNDTAFTVVGIAPPDFIGTGIPPQVPDFWAPLAMQEQVIPGQAWLNLAGAYQIQLLGRLRPGTERKQAQAEAAVLASQFGQMHPERDRTIDVTLQRATFFGNTEDIQFQATVAGFMVVVGMVLLIACANLANMLLARSTLRRKEIGIRLALGASRVRLIRQMLTESILLSLMGGSVGLLFSIWASKLLWLVIAPLLEGIFWSDALLAIPTGPDVRIFVYTVLLSLLSGVIFGLSPALQSSKPDLTTALKEESNRRMSRSRLRGFLMGGQGSSGHSSGGGGCDCCFLRYWWSARCVAVSVLFLICAGLLVRGLLRSQSADPGFDTRSALMVWCDLGPDEAKAHALQRQIVERLENLREIKGVTVAERFPFMGTWTPPIMPEGGAGSSNRVVSRTLANHVSPSYFDTLGIPILRGRTFTRQEGQTGAHVGIISESGARRLWPGENPLGRRAKLDTKFTDKFDAEFEVIGVVKDVRSANLSRVDPSFVYLPVTAAQSNGILVRIRGSRRDAIASVRTAIEAVDRDLLPSFSMASLEEDPVRIQKLIMQTTTTFAAVLGCLALALAAVGIYGVMSYLVTQRTGEIGIRMALGANTKDVLASVVLSGLRPVFIGAVLGIAGSAGLSAVLHATLVFPGSVDLLFGVNMLDPVTFIGLTVFVACVAALASAIPARRATSVDPVIALRYE